MFKNYLFIAAAMLLAFTGVSNGALVALEEAAELTIEGAKLPNSTNGRLTHRNCSGCKSITWRVAKKTRYQVLIPEESGAVHEVTLGEFQRIFASGQVEDLVVFYKPETNEVTRLFMSQKH